MANPPKPPRHLLHGRLRERSIYLLPNLFTTGALFAGFYAVVQAMNGQFEPAAIAIFIAMVLDGMDGRVARLTRTQSAFGAEYDSLSDMVSFGVAPALVLYVWALKPMGKLGWIAAFIYCAGAALRLARFNTKLDESDKRYFQGLPSPAAAALLAGLVWVMYENKISGADILFDWLQVKWLAWGFTVFAGLTMVSDLRYFSGKDFNLRKSVPFVVILCIVLAFVLISYNPPEVLFTLFVAYGLSGYVGWAMRRMRGRKGEATYSPYLPRIRRIAQPTSPDKPDATNSVHSTAGGL
ncbi:MAG: CDP-diacylglycerol--serine O-phosphatidyltransferase [Methylobacillus sp.]|jgi:CDP-diacylglycerol--serine O-phosphatidyltransferase|nr:CDP-diacylglycerol--serine O-phosphatidyltransferase [Methylobacillus sp.]